MNLDFGRGLVGYHGAQVFEPTAHDDDRSDTGGRPQEIAKRRSLEDLCDQPAKKCQTRNAEDSGDRTDRHSSKDPPSHTFGELPKAEIKIHCRRSTTSHDWQPGERRCPTQSYRRGALRPMNTQRTIRPRTCRAPGRRNLTVNPSDVHQRGRDMMWNYRAHFYGHGGRQLSNMLPGRPAWDIVKWCRGGNHIAHDMTDPC